MELPEQAKQKLHKALEVNGLRSTRQREHVLAVLLAKRDHPTAEEVYERAKASMASISLATVYNCLETLVGCGLVRAVNFERGSNHYCPNLAEHAHFHCKDTGRVYDIDLPEGLLDSVKKVLPEGFQAEGVEVAFQGHRAKEILS